MQNVNTNQRLTVVQSFASWDFVLALILPIVFWYTIPSYESRVSSKAVTELPDSPVIIQEMEAMKPMQLAQSGEFQVAQTAANDLLKRDGLDPLNNLCAGSVFIASGVSEDGLARLKKAVALSHRNRYVVLYYAQKLADLGKTGEAITQFKALGRAYPQWKDPHFDLSRLYLSQKQPAEAAGELGAICDMDPKDFQSKKMRGIALARAGDTKAGLDEYLEGLAMESQDGPPEVLRGLVADTKGASIDRAIYQLQQQITNRPGDYTPKLRLAQLYSYLNNAHEAKDLLLDCRHIAPNNPEVQRTLAVVLKKLGESNTAVSAFSTSVRLEEAAEHGGH